jgi:hypothetical protein
MKIKEISLGGGFLAGLGAAAFRHNGIVQAASEAFWKLIKLIVPVNLDGFLGRIHDHVAFFAPVEMLIELDFQVLADLAVKIVGQLL